MLIHNGSAIDDPLIVSPRTARTPGGIEGVGQTSLQLPQRSTWNACIFLQQDDDTEIVYSWFSKSTILSKTVGDLSIVFLSGKAHFIS